MSANSYSGVVAVQILDNTTQIGPEKHNDEEQSPNTENNDAHSRRRSQIVISIFEKLNMLFLLFLVCYLSWTIPANYGLFNGFKSNEVSQKNSTFQGQSSQNEVSLIKHN